MTSFCEVDEVIYVCFFNTMLVKGVGYVITYVFRRGLGKIGLVVREGMLLVYLILCERLVGVWWGRLMGEAGGRG